MRKRMLRKESRSWNWSNESSNVRASEYESRAFYGRHGKDCALSRDLRGRDTLIGTIATTTCAPMRAISGPNHHGVLPVPLSYFKCC